MKKLILILLLLTPFAFGTDLAEDTVTMTCALSDTILANCLDADTTDPIFTGNWQAMSLKWDVTDDSNFTNDTIIFITQYSQLQSGGTWISIPGMTDTIAIGAADTTSYKRIKAAVRDSFGLWARVVTQHYMAIDSETVDPLVGNSYNWYIKNWLDKIFK